MHKPGIQVLVRAAAAMSVVTAVAACGGHQDPVTTAPSASASRIPPCTPPSWRRATSLEREPESVQRRGESRRRPPWALHYLRGKGLVEQHYSPRAKAWTEPKVIYRTKTDACQGIHLRTKNGTVAAIADFGSYCYDGEPRPNPSRPSVPAV